MKKVIGTIFIVGFLIGLLIWMTPVTRLGSGFLIGNTRFVITYFDLVKDAGNIKVKFPNQDDISAKSIYKNKSDNVAILELLELPKVKREPLFIQAKHSGHKEAYVFTLGYPWTNTLEDKHTFLEGSLASLDENSSGYLQIDMDLDPIHSGSPLFNANREVVGMVISAKTKNNSENLSEELNQAIPATVLIEALKANNIIGNAKPAQTLKDLPIEKFIEEVSNNVVLIETS